MERVRRIESSFSAWKAIDQVSTSQAPGVVFRPLYIHRFPGQIINAGRTRTDASGDLRLTQICPRHCQPGSDRRSPCGRNACRTCRCRS